MQCKSTIYHGMVSIEIDDGDWKRWNVYIGIIFEDDGRIMNDTYSIHAGERIHGAVYVR